MPSIAVVGTGAFATGLCGALPSLPLKVFVLGRTRERAAAVCSEAMRRGTEAEFRPVAVDLDADLRPVFAALVPDVLAVCASYQSPGEMWGADNEWSRLVRRVGFAATLPLQARVADRCAAACAEVGDAAVVNACFPDAVNAVLRARGRPVLCGVGNVGTLASLLGSPGRLKLLAHHAHLHQPADPALEARCWLDDEPRDAARLLARARALPRARLNDRGAAEAARLVAAMATGTDYTGHVPGPHGLPGGYPVEVRRGSISLRLPPGMSVDEAVEWNQRASTLDGATVSGDGHVRLIDPPDELRLEYPAEALDEVCDEQLRLRARLRGLVPS